MKMIVRVLALLLALATPAVAQGPGQLQSGRVWGNPGASTAPASPATITSMFDRAFSSSRGAIITRGAAAWAALGPGTAGLPLLSAGAGADLAYGILGLSGGGTAAALVASNGGIVYSGASALAILSGTATAGQMLRSGSSAAPSWSTATWPATVALGDLLYGSSTNVVGALAVGPSGDCIGSTGTTIAYQSCASGTAIKAPVDVATTANITLSGDQTIDGTLLSSLPCWATVTCRALVKNQSTGSQNGLYTPKAGVWTRTVDFDGFGEVVQGTSVFVTSGTVNASNTYAVTTSGTITIGSTSIAFSSAVSSSQYGVAGGAGSLIPGPPTPLSPGRFASNWTWGTSADITTMDTVAGIWPQAVWNGFSFTRSFDSSTDNAVTHLTPVNAVFMLGVSDGTNNAVNALTTVGYAKGNGDYVSGGNDVCLTEQNSIGVVCVGREIDVEFGAGSTPGAGSAGLYMNVFNVNKAAVGMQFGGVGGGTWINGILFGGIATDGAALGVVGGASSMRSFIDTTSGTFSSAAILLGNNQPFAFDNVGGAGNKAYIRNNTANSVEYVAGANNIHGFLANDGTSNLFAITNTTHTSYRTLSPNTGFTLDLGDASNRWNTAYAGYFDFSFGIFGTYAVAPSTPPASRSTAWFDSTDLRFHDKNAAGIVGTTVVADTGVSNNYISAISAAGVITKSQPTIAGIAGLGTGAATALGTNVGSAGAFVVNGGALGTPASGVATNLTGTAAGLTAGTVTTNANLTGDVTSVGNATTLATVNSNVGTFGSATAIPVVTVNGKGLVTAVTTAAPTAKSFVRGTTLPGTVGSGSTTHSGVIGNAVRNAVWVPVSTAATFRRLYAKSSAVPGGADTYVVTVYNVNTGTAITCTIPSAGDSCNDTSNTATFAAGDLLSVQIVASATAAATTIQWALEADVQ